MGGMTPEVRWLTPGELVELNPVLESRGYMQVNDTTARALGAFGLEAGLLEAFVLQLVPLLGPLVRVDHTHRDNGDLSRQLVARMHAYLDEVAARGYITVCDSPISERLAKRHAMVPLSSPVYVRVA